MSQHEIEELRQELGMLRREMAQRLIRPAINQAPYMSLLITGGQALPSSTALYPVVGIKNVSLLSTVSSLWDPNAGGTYQDGIGTAILFIDGISQGNVLVVNDGRAGITSSLAESWRCRTAVTVSIPWVTDPTQSVLCYIPSGA